MARIASCPLEAPFPTPPRTCDPDGHELSLAGALGGSLACLAPLLVRPDKLRVCEQMALHRGLELRFGRLPEVTQYDVERVELVEIPVPTDRRTGPAVAGPLPVVEPLAGSRGQTRWLDALGQTGGGRRDIVDDPMHPRELRCRGIGCVGIVHDEDEALGLG